MDLEQLKYFVAVAKHKNFSKAASELYIGQPALSRQISKLEAHLGVQLFHRSSKAVSLTEAGILLLKESEDIIQRANQLERGMKKMAQGYTAPLRIAVLGRVSARISAALKAASDALLPNETILECVPHEKILERLLHGDADLILTFEDKTSPFDDRVSYTALEPFEFVYLLPKGHPLSQKEFISRADVANEHLFFLETETPTELPTLLRKCHLPETQKASLVKNLDSMALRTETGGGIGFMPSFLASKYTSHQLIQRRSLEGAATEQLALVWGNGVKNPLVDQFVSVFIEDYRASSTQMRDDGDKIIDFSAKRAISSTC